MKLIRKLLCLLLVFGLVFSLAGCNLGGVGKVDKDGNLVIKGDDGDIVMGKAKWDKSKMFGLEAPNAKLESYYSADGNTMYAFSGMKEKDAEAYINKIKQSNYTYSVFIIDDYSYTGTNKDGQTVSFSYDKDSKEGSVMTVQGEKPSENDEGGETILGGDNAKWDSTKMGGLPDPSWTIISYWSSDGYTSYMFEKVDNYMSYVEKIKSKGFTVSPSDVAFEGGYMYSAANSNGNKITFSISEGVASITFEKE